MILQALSLELRPRSTGPKGLAPAGVLRDRQAEKRKALEKATAAAIDDAPPARKHEWVPLKKGDATDVYTMVASKKTLLVVPKQKGPAVLLESVRKARMAAMSRWHKGNMLALGAAEVSSRAVIPSEGHRYMRRGEFELMPAAYRPYDASELLAAVYQAKSKSVKWTEIQKNYDEGKTRVPPSVIKGVLYPKAGADAKIKLLEDQGLKRLGGPRQVTAV